MFPAGPGSRTDSRGVSPGRGPWEGVGCPRCRRVPARSPPVRWRPSSRLIASAWIGGGWRWPGLRSRSFWGAGCWFWPPDASLKPPWANASSTPAFARRWRGGIATSRHLGFRLARILNVDAAVKRHSTLSGYQGRVEIAAEGGAGRRAAKNADRPMNQSRETHRSVRPLHSPDGHALVGIETDVKASSEGPFGAEGLPQSKHSLSCKPLTCRFAPLAGLEPAPYGLEVDPRLSMPCSLVLSALLRSGASSSGCGPVMSRGTWRNDQRNDQGSVAMGWRACISALGAAFERIL